MVDNPNTNYFRAQFKSLKFPLIETAELEAEQAVERQRKMAEVLARPNQRAFRKAVFELLGYRCAISGCGALDAIETAHIVPISKGGSDEPWNGLPLRADLHRLFDAGLLSIEPTTLVVTFAEEVAEFYDDLDSQALKSALQSTKCLQKIKANLRRRLDD